MIRATILLVVPLFCQLLLAQRQPDPTHYSVNDAAVGTIGTHAPSSHDSLRTSEGQVCRVSAAAPRPSWRGFWAITAAASALTVTDIELSQACLQRGTCADVTAVRKIPRSPK